MVEYTSERRCFLMASKGQKFNRYSKDIKEAILLEIQNGVSLGFLSRKYNVPSGTIMTWSHKLRRPELYPGQGQKRGRKKEKDLTKEDWKERYEILKKYQAFLKAQREKK